MTQTFKICIQSAETRQEWGEMQDDYIKRAMDAANRIERLERALLECELIVSRAQKENEQDTEWKGSKTRQLKTRAVAARCGMLLGDIRKHVRSALEGKDA